MASTLRIFQKVLKTSPRLFSRSGDRMMQDLVMYAQNCWESGILQIYVNKKITFSLQNLDYLSISDSVPAMFTHDSYGNQQVWKMKINNLPLYSCFIHHIEVQMMPNSFSVIFESKEETPIFFLLTFPASWCMLFLHTTLLYQKTIVVWMYFCCWYKAAKIRSIYEIWAIYSESLALTHQVNKQCLCWKLWPSCKCKTL